MDIGLGAPQVGLFADPERTRRLAVAAEAAGYASLWAFDRLLAPANPRTPYPASADRALPREQYTAMDPLITLTVAATVTERIRLATGVLVAPWYPPMLLARSVASLDQVSNGRLTLGLGLGWSADEFDAVGVPQRHLATRIEEILEVMTVAWRDEVVEIETSREVVAPSTIGLKPYAGRRPPVLLATYQPSGLERLARRADGWIPAGLPIDALVPMWGTVLEMAERYGRNPDALRLVVRADPKFTTSPLGADRPLFAGTVAQIRGDIERTRDIGVHEVILDLQGSTRSVDEMLDVAGSLTEGLLARAA